VLWPGLFAILLATGLLQLAEKPLRPEEVSLAVALCAAGAAILFAAFAFGRRLLTLLDLGAVIVLSLASLAFVAFLPEADLVRKALGGAIVVLAALWAVTLGQNGRHPIGKSIGLIAFGIEAIYLYIFTIGTLLDTAFAFLIGGVLFIVLAWVLFRVDRILARHAAAAAIAAEQRSSPAAMPTPVPDLPAQLRSVDLPPEAAAADQPDGGAKP
jgi:uncharacterized membrane protein